MTRSAASRELGISTSTIDTWARKGYIQRAGRYYSRDELIRMIAMGEDWKKNRVQAALRDRRLVMEAIERHAQDEPSDWDLG